MEKNSVIPNSFLPDTVFIAPILNKQPNLVFNVFQKNEYGKHELIGKIYHEQNKYTVRDENGQQIFKDTIKLSVIKSRFKEQGVQQELRRQELESLRERKSKAQEKDKQINR